MGNSLEKNYEVTIGIMYIYRIILVCDFLFSPCLEKTALYVEDCCGTRWVSEEDLETSYVGLRLA